MPWAAPAVRWSTRRGATGGSDTPDTGAALGYEATTGGRNSRTLPCLRRHGPPSAPRPSPAVQVVPPLPLNPTTTTLFDGGAVVNLIQLRTREESLAGGGGDSICGSPERKAGAGVTELQRATLTAMGNTRGCHPDCACCRSMPLMAGRHRHATPPYPQGYGSCHANCGCCILRHPDVYMDGPS